MLAISTTYIVNLPFYNLHKLVNVSDLLITTLYSITNINVNLKMLSTTINDCIFAESKTLTTDHLY